MKIMIASDLHGSAKYVSKLMEAYKRENPDRLLLLGDILYHGPRNALPDLYDPKEVISLLQPAADKIICVRGNCDTEVDAMVLPFDILAPRAVLLADGVTIYAAHGHNLSDDFLSKLHGEILLCGHTHVPECREYGNYTYINPGSVSIPKQDSPHSYMIFDGIFHWKTLGGEEYNQKEITK